jgi:hypothetical protein
MLQTFRVTTFAGLAKKPGGQSYDPGRDDGKGVVRLSTSWGRKLGAERGDLVRVSSKRCSRVYTLKMAAQLEDNEIALGYEQRAQLGIARQPGPVNERELDVRKARWGTLPYLWHHIDPAIRFPFRISAWLFTLGVGLGAIASYLLEHSITSLLTMR